ncbi:HAD-IC family P-type ATPase, partial [Streptomyces sp. NPDC054841]
GESVPVDKDLRMELPEAATLRAGTVVVRGRGAATVTATGAASALGRIAALLEGRREPTPLQRRLAALGRVLACITLALCLLVFVLGLAGGQAPQQKLDIVEAWHGRGDVTAMTGDGVNDGPALRQADIGVAMGRRGTEVARQSADLVLTDDELSTVVAAVEEGRRVYDNIRRFLVYGLAGGAAEILVMLVGPLLGLVLPLRAGQILWINLLTHGLTGVAMGAEPVSPHAMRRPPRPPHQHVLGHGLWQRVLFLGAVVTAACLVAALSAHAIGAPWQSVLFLSLLAAQLGVVLGLRTRLLTRENLFLPLAVLASACLAAAALYVPFLSSVLETEPLGWTEVVMAAGAGLTGFAAARLSGRPWARNLVVSSGRTAP